MQAVVGVVRRYSDALQIVEALRAAGIPDARLSALSPASALSPSADGVLNAIPTTDAEQPGIGGTIGRVVGGAAGTAGGLAVASLALPGVGPVIAAGAIALGLIGAAAGGAVGSHLDDTLSKGLPTDELYVYRHALQMGRSIVVAMVEDDAQAAKVRELIAGLGAESVDAAREEWWVGLRDAEEAEYTRQGGDFRRTRRSIAWDSTRRSACPGRPRPSPMRARSCGTATGRRPRSRPSGRATSVAAHGGVRRVGQAGCGPRSGNRRSDADHPVPGLSGRRMCVQPGRGPTPPEARVLDAAVLRALTSIHTGTVRLEPGLGRTTGNQVHLPLERGNPEAVDDIARREPHPHAPAGGNVQLVGGRHGLIRGGAGIVDLPPPLVPGHLDREVVGRSLGGERSQAPQRRGDQQDADEGGRRGAKNEDRDDATPVVGGGRHAPRPPRSEDGTAQERQHRRVGRAENHEERPRQPGEIARGGARRCQRGLWPVARGAKRQDEAPARAGRSAAVPARYAPSRTRSFAGARGDAGRGMDGGP